MGMRLIATNNPIKMYRKTLLYLSRRYYRYSQKKTTFKAKIAIRKAEEVVLTVVVWRAALMK